MAGWPVYSERLVSAGQPSGFYSTTVPAGYRAVLTDISIGNAFGLEGLVQVQLAGRVLWAHSLQASELAVRRELRVPAYAGETIAVYLGLNDVGCYVSGYLFNTGPASDDAALDTSYRAVAAGKPLPA
jgi:hypothetical protein